MMRTCPHCGTTADETDRFCETCGKPLETTGRPVAGAEAAPNGAEIVVEVQTNAQHVLGHASLLRFRVTSNLPGDCDVTVRARLDQPGVLVEQKADKIEQACRFDRRGGQGVFSFPFRGLVPGEIAVEELRILVAPAGQPDARIVFDLPDRGLFVRVAGPAVSASAPGTVISGPIHIDFSRLEEMYGSDIKNLLNLDVARETEPGQPAVQWEPILLRLAGAGCTTRCALASCKRPLLPQETFTCEQCRLSLCRSHQDDEKPDACKTCAEVLRAGEFARAAAALPSAGNVHDAWNALAALSPSRPAFQARVWTERGVLATTRDISTVPRESKSCFQIGERFTLNVQSEKDCYLTLVDVGTSGKTCLLLSCHPVRAGSPVGLSGPDARRQWAIDGPPGIERLKAFFTTEPRPLFSASGVPALLGSPTQADDLTREIENARLVLAKIPPGSWTDATCEFVVRDS